MIRMIEWSVPDTSWTTILYRLVVRVSAFATDTGVIDVIPFPMLSTCYALDLIVG